MWYSDFQQSQSFTAQKFFNEDNLDFGNSYNKTNAAWKIIFDCDETKWENNDGGKPK